MELLKKKILKFIGEIEGKVAVYIKHMNTGESICIQEKERFHAASMIKIPILLEALRQVEAGVLKLTNKFQVHDTDKVGGCGVLSILHQGIELTVDDLLHLMIDISDNTATNMLIDILGKDNVNDTLTKLGIENTYLARKLMITMPNVYSYTTAEDMGILFEKLVKFEGLGKSSIDKAIEILLAQQLNDRLSQKLNCCGSCGYRVGYENICPECGASMSDVDTVPVKFAHKTGEITGAVHDGGILYIGDTTIVIVVLTKDLKRNLDGYDLLANIGLEVYQYYTERK